MEPLISRSQQTQSLDNSAETERCFQLLIKGCSCTSLESHWKTRAEPACAERSWPNSDESREVQPSAHKMKKLAFSGKYAWMRGCGFTNYGWAAGKESGKRLITPHCMGAACLHQCSALSQGIRACVSHLTDCLSHQSGALYLGESASLLSAAVIKL